MKKTSFTTTGILRCLSVMLFTAFSVGSWAQVVTWTIPAAPANQFGNVTTCSTNPANAITLSANSTVAGTMNAYGTGTRKKVKSVTVNYHHTWNGDVAITMTSPAGQTITLKAAGSGGFQANAFVRFVNSNGAGANPYAACATAATWPAGSIGPGYASGGCAGVPNTVPFDVQAGGSFAAFNTGSAAGTWSLTFTDNVGGDGGNVDAISMEFEDAAQIASGPIPTQSGETLTLSLPQDCNSSGASGTVNSSVSQTNYVLNWVTTGALVSSGTGGTVTANFPVGTTNVIFTATNSANCDLIRDTVRVVAARAPFWKFCPTNSVVQLTDGQCTWTASWVVPEIERCGAPAFSQQTPGLTQSPLPLPNPNNAIACGAGVSAYGRCFDTPTIAADSFFLNGLRYGVWRATAGSQWQVRIWKYTGAFAPGALNLTFNGNLQLVRTFPVTMPSFTNVGIHTFNFPNLVGFAKGDRFYIDVQGVGGGFTNCPGLTWPNGVQTNPSYIASNICATGNGANPIAFGSGGVAAFTNAALPFEVLWGLNAVPFQCNTNGTTTPTPTPVPGQEYGPGTYRICYCYTDPLSGLSTQCCWNVEVRKFTNFTNTLVCNDWVNVSLDTFCQATIGADMVLEGGPYSCFDDYAVQIATNMAFTQGVRPAGAPRAGMKPTLGPSDVGKTYFVRVVDPRTGNSCWGQLKVEDKIPPRLVCKDVTVNCDESLEPANVTGNITQVLTPNYNLNFVNNQGNAANPHVVDLPVSVDPTIRFRKYTVGIKITNSGWVGDLNADLVTPGGERVQLCRFIGPDCNGAACDIVLDNDAAVSVSSNTVNCGQINGGQSYKPLGALTIPDFICTQGKMNNQMSGTYKFIAWDDFTFDALGTLAQVTFNFIPTGVGLPNNLTLGLIRDGFNAEKIGSNPNRYRVVAGLVDVCSEVTLTYTDKVVETPCSATNDNVRVVTRTWLAVDASGNRASCNQTITVKRAKLENLSFPRSWDGQPGNNRVLDICLDFGKGHINPIQMNDDTARYYGYRHNDYFFMKLPNGHPAPKAGVLNTDTIYVGDFDPGRAFLRQLGLLTDLDTLCIKGTGMPSGALCGTINMSYTDTHLPICGDGYKLIRDWRVLDWCTGQIRNYTQVIKVMDTQPPVIDCDNSTVSTDPTVCTASGLFGAPTILRDNCTSASYDVEIVGTMPDGASVTQNANGTWSYAGFPCGTYRFKYTGRDACDNLSQPDTCTMTVRDQVNPVAVGRTVTNVALTNVTCGTATVEAWKFDEGSWDNCGEVYFKVRRMAANETPAQCRRDQTCGNDGRFDDAVKFCCDDVGKQVTVILRVYDARPAAGPVGLASDAGCSYRPTHPCGGLANFNDVMIQVIVEDKLAPGCIAPENLTIDCNAYDFDIPLSTKNFAYFDKYFGGMKKQDCKTNETRTSRIVNTTSGNRSVIDGLAFDNCTANVVQDLSYTLTCGQGDITRTFTVTDAGGKTSRCTQRITIINTDPFWINTNIYTDKGDPRTKDDGTERRISDDQPDSGSDDIIWPDKEFESVTCTSGGKVDPDISGRPRILRNDKCDLVAVTYEDLILPIQPPACFKILRKWIVVDWCQDKPLGRRWEYTQVIKVVNTTAPTIKSTCKDTVICQYPTDCYPTPLTLCVDADDDCTPKADLKYTWRVDVGNNGSFDAAGNGSCVTLDRFNGLTWGRHMITWAVEDGCSNVKTCTYVFEVKDCKKPTPIAKLLTIELMPVVCMVDIDAKRVDNFSYDNCTTADKLRFRLIKSTDPLYNQATKGSVSPNDVNFILSLSETVTFTRDEIGTQTVALFVIDELGNFDYTETYIVVQNNMDPNCGSSGSASITGTVKTEDNENVENVKVQISTVGGQKVTGVDGLFAFLGLNKGTSYVVTPEKDMNPLNGVSTYDLVMISKHILGIEKLNTPYKLVAADVNKSKTITTFDMVELRKLILRINDNFVGNTSWRFVDKSFSFKTTEPLKESFNEVVTVNNLQGAAAANFVAVKVGDVNGNASPNSLLGIQGRNAVGTFAFDVQDATLKAGETRTVEFRAQDLAKVQGYQFTMNFDKNALEFVDVKGNVEGLTADNFGLTLLNEGAITTSWNGNAQNVKADDVLFTVTFKAKKNTQLSSALSVSSQFTSNEAYTVENEDLDVVLTFNGKVSDNAFALFQNMPNPFNGKTVISFSLPEAANATLTIFDAAGRTLKTIKGDFAKGYNEVTVEKSELNASGVLSYRLTTDKFSATKQMIVTE